MIFSLQGYSRKAAALAYLDRTAEAAAVYQKGLQLDPKNQQLKDGLVECRAKVIPIVTCPMSFWRNSCTALLCNVNTLSVMKIQFQRKLIVHSTMFTLRIAS